MKAYQYRSKFGTIAVCVAIAVVIIVVGAVVGWWDRAHSQESPSNTPLRERLLPCHRYEEIVEKLSRIGDEQIIFEGVNEKGNLVSVLASPAKNWTYLVTSPGGCSIIIDHGTDITSVKPTPPGKDT